MFTRVFRVYQKTLTGYPILSQALQAGFLMGSGDVICQKLVEKKENINWGRTAKFTSVGIFFLGPTLTKWYGVLNKYIGSSGSKVALKKVALDQFVFAPGLIAVLLTVFNGLQGLSFDDSIKKLRNDYPDVLVNNYLLWPGVQLVNFWVVPLHYQVLVVQLVALFWNTYMSWKAHTKLVI